MKKVVKYSINPIMKFIGTILLLIFIMFEEIILSPLRKIRIIFIENFIKKLSAHLTIAIFVTLKIIEGLLKFGLVIFKDNPIMLSVVIFLDIFLGFISLQILIHGRENLRYFKFYRKGAIFIYRLKKDLKKKPIYQKAKTRYFLIKERVLNYYNLLMNYIKAFKFAIFGHEKAGIIEYAKFRFKEYITNKKRS
jgi:hypothetical protein